MPPRKKARVSQAASPDPEPDTPGTTTSPDKADEQVLNDPWTDDEEIGLFKGLMRWKPTGIHKHFRLIALHSWLLENNYIHPRNEHTKPAGIWAKLSTLYDLNALDARENARQLSPEWTSAEQEKQAEEEAEDDAADVYSLAANKIENEDFSLPPEDGFDEMMWKARFPQDKGEDSELELPELNLAEQPPVRFTPSFSIEPSEAATPKRGRGAAKGRGSRGGAAASETGGRRRSTRNTESVADKEEEKDEEEEAEDEDEEEEDDEDEEESEEEEEEEDQASTTGTRRGRSAKATRGKPAARGRTKGRGRGK